MSIQSGQCLCGQVSFELNATPVAVRICWCRDWQHLAANGTVNLLTPRDSVRIIGHLAEFVKVADSGQHITRQFCPNCGSHMFAQSSARPEILVIRMGNLDNPSAVKPTVNIWTDSAPTWACLDSNLDAVAQQPTANTPASSA